MDQIQQSSPNIQIAEMIVRFFLCMALVGQNNYQNQSKWHQLITLDSWGFK